MASQSFKTEFLNTHNSYRAKHSAPPLKYNEELNKTAQKWADQLLARNSLGHSDTKDGENVFYMSSSSSVNPTGKEAVDSWYSEIKDYKFDDPGFGGNTGHFTQVVWQSSTELGVGMATNGQKLFVVGQYRPAGNIANPGFFEKNVLPKV
ncbi:Golgi-associated plant pathogenesis-related protein 1-like [Parambassis ranga]|uniref:Golgi-associated plant pathogenesis-related protein 1-like n=1 Tax=Parambassis ranga TaxID=210632 RepID=A0A6P7IXX5_9TELE|nr:Golgi-associated plant pathogenesis-related protein 1-like [Parambassis ranga]